MGIRFFLLWPVFHRCGTGVLLHQILTNKKCHKTTGTSKSAVPKRPFLMLGIPACETESGLLHPHQQLCFGNQVDNSSCYDLFPTTQCRCLTQTPVLSGLSRGWIRGSMVGVGTARNFSSYYRHYPGSCYLMFWHCVCGEKGSDSSCWDFFSTGVVLLLNLEAGHWLCTEMTVSQTL